MSSRRILLMFCALALVCGAAFAEPAAERALSVKTFQFKFKEADKAAAVIKPLMSADGSISIVPSSHSLVVTDRAENMKAIGAALAQFDTPAQSFHLSLRLVSAGRADRASRVPKDLEDIAPQLSMLRFNSIEKIGESNYEGKEGDAGIAELQDYRADVTLGEYDLASDTVKVELKLSKLSGAQHDQLAQVLKTTLNLKPGQTTVLGTAKTPQSQRAMFLVAVIKR